jgi:hypothetical protein
MNEPTDWIRETVAARATERGLTAYAVAELCRADGHPIDHGTVKRYFDGRCALTTRHVSAICDVLGLVMRPGRKRSG